MTKITSHHYTYISIMTWTRRHCVGTTATHILTIVLNNLSLRKNASYIIILFRKNSETPKYLATPVRRSSRLSGLMSSNKKRTPLLQICSSMQQIEEGVRTNLLFVPNKTLEFTPWVITQMERVPWLGFFFCVFFNKLWVFLL